MTEETLNYLRKAKVSEKEIARLHYDELYEDTLIRLKRILSDFKNEEFTSIQEVLFFSPAGDGYGFDNHCINFGTEDEPKDIGEVIDQLTKLKKQRG